MNLTILSRLLTSCSHICAVIAITFTLQCTSEASEPPIISKSSHEQILHILSITGDIKDYADHIHSEYLNDREGINRAAQLMPKWSKTFDPSTFKVYSPELQSEYRRLANNWNIDQRALIRQVDDRYFELLTELPNIDKDKLNSIKIWRFINWRCSQQSQLLPIVKEIGIEFKIKDTETQFDLNREEQGPYREIMKLYEEEMYLLACDLDTAIIARETQLNIKELNRPENPEEAVRRFKHLSMQPIYAAIAIRKRHELFIRNCSALFNPDTALKFETYCLIQLDPAKKKLSTFHELLIRAASVNDLTKEQVGTLEQLTADYESYRQQMTSRLEAAHRTVMNPSVSENFFESTAKSLIDYNEGIKHPPSTFKERPNKQWRKLFAEVEKYVTDKSDELRKTLKSHQWRKIQ